MLFRFSKTINLKFAINSLKYQLNNRKFINPNISKQFCSSNSTTTNDTQIIAIDQNVEKYLNGLCNEYDNLRQQQNDPSNSNKTIKYQRINLLKTIVNVYNYWKQVRSNLSAIQTEIDMEKDKEMLKMLDDEKLVRNKIFFSADDNANKL